MFPPNVQAVMDRVDRLRETVDDHWQIPRVEAELLAQIVRMGRCVSLCEIGVSYGYSTLHLAAAAAPHGGRVHAFDIDPKKIKAATEHLTQAGLSAAATLHLGDARHMVAAVKPERPYDFVFIDATKDQSFDYLAAALPKLAPRATLITDNTGTHRDELACFIRHLRALPGALGVDVPVGNGFDWTIVQR